MEYSKEILDNFLNHKNIYNIGEKYDVMGFGGEQDIGELINLYFTFEKSSENILNSKIISAKFSAIGGVILIGAAEQLCIDAHNRNFSELLTYLTSDEFRNFLKIPEEKLYSFNFLINAYYKVLENLSNQC